MQIGLDPFSQQLATAALLAGSAAGVAYFSGIDLASSFRLDSQALVSAGELSLPVLALALVVAVPKWGRDPKGLELERLRQNYFLTAQVLRLYYDDDEDSDSSDDESDSIMTSTTSSDASWDEPSSERARVKRRLRLDQSVSFTTLSSALALMQAYSLQPWNPSTPNAVVGLTLAGRSLQQLAGEVLVRGALAGLIIGWVTSTIAAPGEGPPSPNMLWSALVFKLFGGSEAPKFATGALLVALSVPGALWEARAARNFVRASVVGPVRDAAIFCKGDGINEPYYCDPKGFAFLASRRPANAASVADVVTRTKGWRSPGSPSASMDADGSEQLRPSAAPTAGPSTSVAPGATLSAGSAAFDLEDADMGVLLKVETLQDKVAFWATAYYQVLCAFAVNGAFLASDCNILASFGVVWLLRTAPLVVVELLARARDGGAGPQADGTR